MTDEQLKAAAEAAELASEQRWYGEKIMAAAWKQDTDLLPYLRRFAEAIGAAEREWCASLCAPRPPLVNSDPEWIMLTELAERMRSGPNVGG